MFKIHLLRWIEDRMLHKLHGLENVIQWMESDECLRKTLYAKFQADYKPATFQCCSNCGVTISKWEKQTQNDNIRTSTPIDWRLKLRTLLVGDNDETK